MAVLIDETRKVWLPGIQTVSGLPGPGLKALFAAKDFEVHSPVSKSFAEITYRDFSPVIIACASDSTRMASASIESISSKVFHKSLPKFLGWSLIRAYYAAFFAAHALCRIFGQGVYQLDSGLTKAIEEQADLYGQLPTGVALQGGPYKAVADPLMRTVTLEKLAGDGPHEAFWMHFLRTVQWVSTSILAPPNNGPSSTFAVSRLSDLESALTADGRWNNGSWLSKMRNQINYEYLYSTWYPYTGRPSYYDAISRVVENWEGDPDKMLVSGPPGREMMTFVQSCVFLVATCRSTCIDLHKRSPKPSRSVQHFTTMRLLNQLTN